MWLWTRLRPQYHIWTLIRQLGQSQPKFSNRNKTAYCQFSGRCLCSPNDKRTHFSAPFTLMFDLLTSKSLHQILLMSVTYPLSLNTHILMFSQIFTNFYTISKILLTEPIFREYVKARYFCGDVGGVKLTNHSLVVHKKCILNNRNDLNTLT